MKYLQALQRQRVFDLAFAASLTKNEQTAKSMLQSYKKAGVIKSVRQNLYVALDLASGNSLAGRFEIGSNITKDAYISHHSALEFHGVANQVFHQVTVTTNTRFCTFVYDDFSYERYSERIYSGVITPPLSPLVRVTDLERTVIDCLYDIDLAGGLEEIIEALTLIPTLNERYLISYLKEYNQIYLWQKAGYVPVTSRSPFKSAIPFLTNANHTFIIASKRWFHRMPLVSTLNGNYMLLLIYLQLFLKEVTL